MPGLGRARLEELEPRRDGGEEAAHGDTRAARRSGRSDLRGDALAHGNLRADLGLGWTRDERDTGDGGDAGERLAPEAKRRDALQIVERADLAGGVAREGQRQVIAREAGAVVGHADEVQPTAHQVNANLPRARVDGVLDQLLDHRGGPLDDLAGGDLGGDILRQAPYRHADLYS